MRRNSNGISARVLVMAVALTLIIGGIIGGSVAWLTATSDPVINTFTFGDINIELKETTGENYKIIPGVDITKNPKVTVKANSEACYLFIKVKEENWPTATEADGTTKKVNYSIGNGWIPLDDQSGVYYREVDTFSTDIDLYVITDNKVTVSKNLTKAEVNSISGQPKLTFTAYAVQKDGIDDAKTAWSKVNP